MDQKFKELDGVAEIIAVIRSKDQYLWFCSDKTLWLMDYKRYAHLFDPNNNDFSGRFDIGILDNSTLEQFVEAMSEYRTSFQELRQLFESHQPVKTFDEVYHLFPRVLIDFDHTELYSSYSELLQIEQYATEGWKSHYASVLKQIPEELRYWCIDGIDYSMYTDE